ncbi:MAG: hypothetical protein IKU60_01785, partial [Clostridia bacterium]|nr:hypothetical protein [Clostridia bacterium]
CKTPYGSPKIATFGGVNAINPSDFILGNLLSQTLRYCAENDFFDSLKQNKKSPKALLFCLFNPI